MTSGRFSGLTRFLLWDYPRASWQYDVMVLLILAFIFLTPREIFRDQPRASNVVMLPSQQDANVFWVESNLLGSVPDAQRGAEVERLLRARFGRRESVVHIEPIMTNEREIQGYMAFTRP
jgi:hypothetical protein